MATATIYHAHFEDPNAEGEAYDTGRDLRMGYEFATEDVGIDVADVFDEAYERAGTVDLPDDVEPDGTGSSAGVAYKAWEAGAGHDPTETRSMAVGDIIAVGDTAWFVDSIGFVAVDVPTDD